MISEERLRELWESVSATTLAAQIYDAMRAVEREARREALEEAAKACDELPPDWHVQSAAAAIRALMEKN